MANKYTAKHGNTIKDDYQVQYMQVANMTIPNQIADMFVCVKRWSPINNPNRGRDSQTNKQANKQNILIICQVTTEFTPYPPCRN